MIKWQDIKFFEETGTQPSKKFTIAKIVNKCLDSTTDNPYEIIEYFLGDYDWTRSFKKPQVIYFDERITVNSMTCLHNWLRQQAGDIENIHIITTHTTGLADWWRQRCELFLEKTFQIEEWLFLRSLTWKQCTPQGLKLPDAETVRSLKSDMQHFFSFYGGAWSRTGTLYLTLKLMPLHNIGVVDLLSKFESSKQEIINHAMYLGYFKNIEEENLMSDLYDQYVDTDKQQLRTLIDKPKQEIETFDKQGVVWGTDMKSFALVVRETDMYQPFYISTEKTMRGFWHHMAVIPVGYRSVEQLESYGFWFPHDIIDYSYQFKTDTLDRFNGVVSAVQKLAKEYTINDLKQYFEKNFENFRKNAQICADYVALPT